MGQSHTLWLDRWGTQKFFCAPRGAQRTDRPATHCAARLSTDVVQADAGPKALYRLLCGAPAQGLRLFLRAHGLFASYTPGAAVTIKRGGGHHEVITGKKIKKFGMILLPIGDPFMR